MFAIVLCAILASATAAPYRNHHHHHWHHDDDTSLGRFVDHDVFDTRRFWEELTREMIGIDLMLADINRRFLSKALPTEGVEGNEYKIKLPLSGYNEKEIAVKAKKGLMIVQAVHKVDGEIIRNYMEIRTLPDFINEQGSWTYDNNLVTITFPLNKKSDDDANVTEEPATQAPVTADPNHSREDMDNSDTTGGNEDADVGAGRGDTDVLTNEIARQNAVEATTYAVDLKGEVELLPVTY